MLHHAPLFPAIEVDRNGRPAMAKASGIAKSSPSIANLPKTCRARIQHGRPRVFHLFPHCTLRLLSRETERFKLVKRLTERCLCPIRWRGQLLDDIGTLVFRDGIRKQSQRLAEFSWREGCAKPRLDLPLLTIPEPLENCHPHTIRDLPPTHRGFGLPNCRGTSRRRLKCQHGK